MSLILIEASLTLLFPLFIGLAIEDALNSTYEGAIKLGALGIVTLVVGVGRRFFDTRFYAMIYEHAGTRMICRINGKDPSIKSARLGMLGEVVEFLEHSFPEIVGAVISLGGVILMIAALNLHIFYGSLLVTIIIFIIYWISSNKTVAFNAASNDEMEKQVEVITQNNETDLKSHLQRMMKWNIKLSDLEAMNFSFTWVIMMAFLVISIIISAEARTVQYGTVIALIMYVFQYIENVVNLPFFYQHWLRLTEIKSRLENVE